jgi:steroid delta-isomerase-like uncharacterized protein
MTDDGKQIVREYYERLNRHDLGSAGELLGDACAVTVADEQLDRDAYLDFLRSWISAFPDLTNRLEEIVAEGSTVAVRSTWEGTHEGPFAGAPATGRRVTFGSFSTSRIEGGRIVERRILANVFGVLQQIGDVSWRAQSAGAAEARDLATDITTAVRALPATE